MEPLLFKSKALTEPPATETAVRLSTQVRHEWQHLPLNLFWWLAYHLLKITENVQATLLQSRFNSL
jgi:hypothetical protein